jgi:hypothetical protein
MRFPSTISRPRAPPHVFWAAEGRGEIIDWRPQTHPAAALGVELVKPPTAPKGTSEAHAFNIIIPKRQ